MAFFIFGSFTDLAFCMAYFLKPSQKYQQDSVLCRFGRERIHANYGKYFTPKLRPSNKASHVDSTKGEVKVMIPRFIIP